MPDEQTPQSVSMLQSPHDVLAELDRLQQQLDQMKAALCESHRLTTLGTLTAVVAHEYNNLLTPIISYAQMALANPEDRALQHKAVTRALDAAQRAAEVSSSILGFASGQASETQASLRRVVEESLACLARAPAKDGIDLDLRLIDATLAISPIDLQQVLVNLILNARKAMRRKGGQLKLHATRQGDCVQLTVADTGPGIPEAVRERLFEPFVTCPINDPADDVCLHEGTGLGLSICRDLLTAAGGAIHLEDNRKNACGACFVLTLPVVAGGPASPGP